MVVSISVPQLVVFELMTEFKVTKWLNYSGSLASNFTPIWSRIENNMKNCINIDLKCLLDLASHMEFPKPFDLLTQKGKKEYSRLSVF